MRSSNINDYPLHFEERCAVIHELANTTIMAIAMGERRVVPKGLRDMVRVPYKFAWGKPKEGA